MKIDLHCHTTISDGSLSIVEVSKLAKYNGVTHLAITDHDTVIDPVTVLNIEAKIGIEIIPGIEISAYDFEQKLKVHIIGHFIQHEHAAIRKICDPIINQRNTASKEMVDIIIDAGYDISWDMVSKYGGDTGVFKQHIMHALMDKGYCVGIYNNLYKKLFSQGNSSNEVGIAYIPIEYADMTAAIHAICDAGGVPILAHPGSFNNFELVPLLVKAGLRGIEVKHPHHNKNSEVEALRLAKKFNLIISCGSDYHGIYGNHSCTIGSNSIIDDFLNSLKDVDCEYDTMKCHRQREIMAIQSQSASKFQRDFFDAKEIGRKFKESKKLNI